VGDVKERLAEVVPSCVVERSREALSEAILHILGIGGRSIGPPLSKTIDLAYSIEKVMEVYLLAISGS
jgi:hypothetical protein